MIRCWLFVIGTLLLTCTLCGQSRDSPRRPNIVWIVGENFDLDFGCYGAKQVATPNVDCLGRGRGAIHPCLFDLARLCAQPISLHDRACMRPPPTRTTCGRIVTTTFDCPPESGRSHIDCCRRIPNRKRHSHRRPGSGHRKTGLELRQRGPAVSGRALVEDLRHEQPFFAQFNMPEAEYDIYDRKSAEKPRVQWVGEEWHPKVATAENVTPPPYYPDHEIVRQEWARYLNSASGMDVRIGWILDQL